MEKMEGREMLILSHTTNQDTILQVAAGKDNDVMVLGNLFLNMKNKKREEILQRYQIVCLGSTITKDQKLKRGLGYCVNCSKPLLIVDGNILFKTSPRFFDSPPLTKSFSGEGIEIFA